MLRANFNPISVFNDKNLVFAYFFLLLPIFDMLNGYLVLGGYLSEGGLASPSQLGRMLGMLVLFYIAFRKRIDISFGFIFLYPILIEVVNGFIHQNNFGFIYGVLSGYKLFYGFLLCMVLGYFCKERADIALLGYFLKLNLILISFSLLFSLATGLGNDTYGHGFGTKGFFASGNGIGIYMGVCSLILLSLKLSGLYNDFNRFWLVIFALSTAVIGSKTALVFSMVLLFLLVWFSNYRVLGILVSACLFAVILPQFLDLFVIVFDIIVARYENSENFFTFLGSGRIEYVLDAFEVFQSHNNIVLRLCFGSGAFVSFQDPIFVSVFDTLETDIFDVLFMYGIFGVIIYTIVFTRLFYLSLRSSTLTLALVFIGLHSLLAGHVIFNGLSVFAISIIFVVGQYLNKQRQSQFSSREESYATSNS